MNKPQVSFLSLKQNTKPLFKQNMRVNADALNIFFVDNHGVGICIRAKKSTPMNMLFAAYCNINRLAKDDVKFSFNGTQLEDHKKVQDYEIVNDDAIDVAIVKKEGGEQTAGGKGTTTTTTTTT